MSEFENGGVPPVVGRKPTVSENAAPSFLLHGPENEDERQALATHFLGVRPASVRFFEMGQESAFHVGHESQHFGDGLYLYTESQSHLTVNGTSIYEPNLVAGVLANYKFAGMPAVQAYLESMMGSDVTHCPTSMSLDGNAEEAGTNETEIIQFQSLDGDPSRKETQMVIETNGNEAPSSVVGTATEAPKCAWFEISLSDDGLELVYSQDAGPSILDCLEDSPIVEAQIAAALRRFHNENIASATPKQAKKLRKRRYIHLGFKAEGISDSDLSMHIILKALQVPDAPEMQAFSVPEVIAMMPDALGYDSSTIDDLEHGDLGAVIQIRQGGLHSEDLWLENCGYLHLDYQGINLDPMSVSDFGNFLYSLIHYSEEVTLATLRHIYENAE